MPSTSSASPAAGRRESSFQRLAGSLELRMFVLTAVVIVVLSFASPYFMTYNNILNVLDQSVVVGIIAVGMTLVILTAGIDLSVGSIVGLTGVAMAKAFPVLGFVPGLGVGLLTGALVGFVNGFIIEKGRVAPFIVTLGMLSVGRSLTYILSGARSIIDLPPELASLALGAHAQLSIEITGTGASRFPVIIPIFENEGRLPQSVTDVVRADLDRSGLFSLVDLGPLAQGHHLLALSVQLIAQRVRGVLTGHQHLVDPVGEAGEQLAGIVIGCRGAVVEPGDGQSDGVADEVRLHLRAKGAVLELGRF